VRALISTWDKTGLDAFARGLAEQGWRLVASGKTAAALEAIGLPVEHVEALTESPEMLGGRVKTLHPRVHAGILARRDEADDVAMLEEHGIEAFDLVCVNLYPFESVASRQGVTEAEAVEMIDIGGPSMLRGAAKNFAHCAPVCRPDQYHQVLEELRANGELSLETRRRLAAEAFAHTAAYEAAIATWFNAREELPESLVISLEKVLNLAYGENPHQRAAYYAERGARRHLLSWVEQLHGKELSFNNLNDLSGARALAREFAQPACVIVRQSARLRPHFRLRGRGRTQSRRRGAARREARGAVHRVAVRAWLQPLGLGGAAAKEEHAHPPRPRAARRPAGRAELQGRAGRNARPGHRLRDRGPRGLAGRDRRAHRAAME
jgi:phosphoribosylaminoimidazolecarboxamide formyltransferase / IMP cyclohydrolase